MLQESRLALGLPEGLILLDGFHIKDPSETNQLSQVIGVVIGRQEDLSKNRVILGMRDRAEKIRFGIIHQFFEGLSIGEKPFDRLLPLGGGCFFQAVWCQPRLLGGSWRMDRRSRVRQAIG